MTDARSLLRAKRTEAVAQISHPLAQYTSSGQLRCIACQTIVKQSAQWAGHVGSKSHRVNVAKMKEKQEIEQREKRKAEEAMEDDDGQTGEEHIDAKRRKTESDSNGTAPSNPNGGAADGFPSDFFSDPSQGPILTTADSDDEDEGRSAPAPAPASQSAAAQTQKSAVDLEFEMFQREMGLSTGINPGGDTEDLEEIKEDTYHRATVFAEPVMASDVPEGFPPPTSTTTTTDTNKDAAPVAKPEPTEEEKKAAEEEKRKEKELEERELIMDRLLEEERAQEEADEKVKLLKDRVEAFKKKRAAAGKGAKK